MYNSNSRKNKRIFILFLITTTLGFFTFSQLNWNFNDFLSNPNSPTGVELFNEPKTSDYSSSSSNIGENMALILHQSYLNNSFNTILNTSDPNNNEFTVPSPEDSTFNSSYTYFKVEDIVAQNKTIDIETGTGRAQDISTDWSFSFEIPQSTILKNFSIALSDNTGLAGGSDIALRLYNATYNAGESRIEPSENTFLITESQNIPIDSGPTWYDFIVNADLDYSQTYGGTFFIRVWRISGGSTVPQFNYQLNTDGTDVNNSLTYRGASIPFVKRDYEASLKVGLGLYDNTPNPTAVNLKINNTIVSDDVGNSGYWIKQNQNYTDNDGNLDFNITADWWDVICNISQVQINYTKTDLSASSKFSIAGSGQIVNWNVTRNGGLNYFDAGFIDYRINFTIPATWHSSSIKVFNGSKEWSIKKRLLSNGYREVEVPNAINGTFWFLNATSDNAIASIETTPTSTFNYSDIVPFNATFLNYTYDGKINLSVFSPAAINNRLNYTFTNSSFGAGLEVYFGNWNISENATKYGIFRFQVAWNNNTSAGFREGTIIIKAETSLEILYPSQNINYDASKIFNITAFYNDTGQNLNISDADIQYKINNGGYSSINENVEYINDGKYNITFDCNNTEFNYGPNNITIKAGGTYYNNQTETLNLKILGLTNLINTSSVKGTFNSTETFVVSMFFNDTVKEKGIDSAVIEVQISGSSYSPISIDDYLDGNYDVTINCSDDIFDYDGYGSFNLSLNIEKSYRYNQSMYFIIYITGETNISATKFPDPIIGYYNSDETFNITAYFEDIGRNEGINESQVTVYAKNVSASSYIVYTTSFFEFGVGYYNITIDCSDPIFSSYGKYNIQINVSKTNYYTASYTFKDELIIGNTTLTILAPTGTISYDENEIFNIVIEYEDHTLTTGINGSNISYTLNGTGFRSDNFIDHLNGTYTITVNTSDKDFGSNYPDYGNRDIIIRANKTNYINLTRTLTFERRILTNITPSNAPSLIEVVRGNSTFYTFKYADRMGGLIDTYNLFQNTTALQNFEWNIVNDGGGFYTLELNTTQVIVVPTPYILNFSIYAFGNQSQEISVTILITIIQTRIEIDSWNDYADFARSTKINISIDFYFNDTTNIKAITGLSNGDITVNTGTLWSPVFELFNRVGNGNYTLNISTLGADSGFYTLELNISKFPNYNWSLAQIQFSLRGNYTQIHLISVTDIGGEGVLVGVSNNYSCFVGRNLFLDFNLTDNEFFDNLVTGEANSYALTYTDILNSSNSGFLTESLSYDANTFTFKGYISTSSITNSGTYTLNLTVIKTNYEITYYTFNLTLKARYDVNLLIVYKPEEVTAGDSFIIILKAEFNNGSGWFPLVGSEMTIIPYFDDIAASETAPVSTNGTGEARFVITIIRTAKNMTLEVVIPDAYNYIGDTLNISTINVKRLPTGLALEDFIPILIIIGAAIGLVGGSIGVYRGVVLPKKREKARILNEVKTTFDDAINLEHVLVLYKGTGTCIYFKSFGSDEIDPELISGFISAICSFGKDLASQEALNEITYGDKMLLLSDGEYIRVTLVLGKKPSNILRKNVTDFVNIFEKTYANELPNWRGQLNLFHNAGVIVDEILNTSIILPHEITYEFSNVKALKNQNSREVLKTATNLMKDSGRSFFFIASLLKEATEKTHKDTAEIFMGIKELRDKKILKPMEIASIGTQPITQQEIDLLTQKISGLVINLTQEEKQKLLNDLAQMGPVEREAYLVSLTEQREIISAPIEEKPGAALINSLKGAKKEIKNLKKIAKQARKDKDYTKALNVSQNAAKIASNWELTGELEQLNEYIRSTKIEDLRTKMKSLEKEAKLAAKEEKYNEAAQKYKMSSKIASEIFKLGGTDMTKEVKRLSNKSKEYEKLI